MNEEHAHRSSVAAKALSDKKTIREDGAAQWILIQCRFDRCMIIFESVLDCEMKDERQKYSAVKTCPGRGDEETCRISSTS